MSSQTLKGSVRDNLPILASLLARLSCARDLIDVNIAAGIAQEELDGHTTGTTLVDELKPIRS